MSFLEERIPTGVRRGSTAGPTALRKMLFDSAGALRVQQLLRPYPLHVFNFDFGTKDLDDAQAVRDFFYVVIFGGYSGFRARDWNDYQLTHGNSRLTLISGSNYQANRIYTVGAAEYVRSILKLEDGTETVYRTRSGVVSVATATVDPDTGIATISGHASGDTYTMEANFDIPVQFADDDALSRVALDGNVDGILQELGEVKLIELSAAALGL